MSKQLSDWTYKAARFAKDRERILELLEKYGERDMAQLYCAFKENYRYLPDIERRMRELVKEGAVKRNNGSIATYELT